MQLEKDQKTGKCNTESGGCDGQRSDGKGFPQKSKEREQEDYERTIKEMQDERRELRRLFKKTCHKTGWKIQVQTLHITRQFTQMTFCKYSGLYTAQSQSYRHRIIILYRHLYGRSH